ncbi:MAG: sulfatase-like hydrolase/transferase [Candidatus Eisenbacteria bacterium]|uniref:Sulfatase-like hydrolase/transferase n=1 Tax=Eiseniibacteriota bacterium TaxID=2212470 RepID=A0A956SC21_UNCEI|nr:sulfatase-like hydrolase/transferase [Candidatus Eisenbacteria bacterium]MCB9463284.1 sulfatase-like hydrolase/transferase [Candidatus Eisenbacteria bacterium]
MKFSAISSGRRCLRGSAKYLSLIGLAVLIGGCSKEAPGPPPPPAESQLNWDEGWEDGPWSVVLITLDTTRSDALSCYGNPDVSTDVLDSLAAEGVRFEEAVSPVPMTLPSHTTLMTGLDPYEHGVRDNGRYKAGPSLETLAERFGSRGYETAAFVSSFPLEHTHGLAQGFGVYDDRFEEQASSVNSESAERRGGSTTDAALAWAGSRSNPSAPYFLWVHYFDPHEPYDPPAPFDAAKSPYLGEVEYMDHEVGRLLRGLGAEGMLANSFVVAVGDHGESLGEHGERTHSYFIYDATQRVPCLLSLPAEHPKKGQTRGIRIDETFRLRDLAPTITNLLGWAADDWAGSRSLSVASWLRGVTPASTVAYVETMTPRLEFGWSDLRGVRSTNWKYIRAPRPELYDLRHDPGETSNIYTAESELVATMESWLSWYLEDEVDSEEAKVEIDAETLERLRSLGYLQGGGTVGEPTYADPKDRIEAFEKVGRAQLLAAQYKNEDAIRLFESVVREDPQNASLLHLLAATYGQARQWDNATQAYERLLNLAPSDPRVVKEAAEVEMLSGRSDRALELFAILGDLDPSVEVWRHEGEVYEQAGDYASAIRRYEAALGEAEQGSERSEILTSIGRAQREMGDLDGAGRSFERAREADPNAVDPLVSLAELAYETGRVEDGDALLAEAKQVDPDDARLNFRLGWRSSKSGELFAAADAYGKAVEQMPAWPEARINYGNALVAIQNYQGALAQFGVALELGEDSASLRASQGAALAGLNRLGDAVAAWQRGLELAEDPNIAMGLQRNIAMARRQLGS